MLCRQCCAGPPWAWFRVGSLGRHAVGRRVAGGRTSRDRRIVRRDVFVVPGPGRRSRPFDAFHHGFNIGLNARPAWRRRGASRRGLSVRGRAEGIEHSACLAVALGAVLEAAGVEIGTRGFAPRQHERENHRGEPAPASRHLVTPRVAGSGTRARRGQPCHRSHRAGRPRFRQRLRWRCLDPAHLNSHNAMEGRSLLFVTRQICRLPWATACATRHLYDSANRIRRGRASASRRRPRANEKIARICRGRSLRIWRCGSATRRGYRPINRRQTKRSVLIS